MLQNEFQFAIFTIFMHLQAGSKVYIPECRFLEKV